MINNLIKLVFLFGVALADDSAKNNGSSKSDVDKEREKFNG
jgi:hypothetical protein